MSAIIAKAVLLRAPTGEATFTHCTREQREERRKSNRRRGRERENDAICGRHIFQDAVAIRARL